MSTTRRRAVALAAALALVGGVLGLADPTGARAEGTPALTLSPAGPFQAGDPVTVSGTGFGQYKPIAVGFCDEGRRVRGPGDCVTRLLTADDNGRVSTMLTIPVGALANQTAPTITCGPTAPCRVTAIDVTDVRQSASVPLWYLGGAARGPDTTGPATRLSSTEPTTTTATGTTFSWTATDPESGVISFDVQTRSQRWDGTLGSPQVLFDGTTFDESTVIDYGVQPGQTRCISARARDLAGNVGPWTTSCAARALDDRALTKTAAWSRTKDAGSLNGTTTTTAKRGATLKLRNARAHRVALVATTCPTCGKVAIYVAGKRVGTVNLSSSQRKKKVVKRLPAFTTRTGTVTVKVLSKRKSVRVDGLVVSPV